MRSATSRMCRLVSGRSTSTPLSALETVEMEEYAVNIGGQEPMAEQKVTIKDVAREAGVSISTLAV